MDGTGRAESGTEAESDAGSQSRMHKGYMRSWVWSWRRYRGKRKFI